MTDSPLIRTDSPDDGAAGRWERAAQLADGLDDDRLERRRRRVILVIVAVMVASWVLGAVLVFALPGDSIGGSASDGSDDDVNVMRLVVAGIVFLVGAVGGIIGFVWARKTGHYITRWRAVWSPLNRQEWKSLIRQVRGKEPADQAHLAVIVAGAKQVRRSTLGVAPLYASIVMMMLASVILGSLTTVTVALFALSAVLFVVAGVQLALQYRSAGRFIARHGHVE